MTIHTATACHRIGALQSHCAIPQQHWIVAEQDQRTPIMQSLAHRGACAEWRIPPSRCCARLVSAHQLHYAHRARTVLSAATQEDAAVISIPASREEAVDVAVAALLGQVKGLSGGKKPKKGFGASSSSSTSSTRFSMELPLPSDSSADVVQLTADVLAKLPAAAAKDACIVFASEQAAAAAAGALKRSSSVLSLRDACRADSLSGPLLLVAPTVADVALAEQLLDEVWSGPWTLVLNPTWHIGTPTQYQDMVESFEAVYSFMPIATQGLMRVEGAVLRHLPPGSKQTSSSPWRVLIKEGDNFMQVGQMKKRPQQSDLELVFINARAAKSPLTSFVKGVKGILDKGKK